ncbi:prolyl oligopeptidase family protein [Sarocladium implicatum]|nr:prolyl oligopeptidase family protein [Sarocladium implicatum]
MAVKRIAPYGDWASPITIGTLTGATRALSDPRVSPVAEDSFFLEARPNGENTIIQITDNGLKDILPKQYHAANSAYEYGGSTYEILYNGKIIFTNGADDSVHVLDPETGMVEYLTGKDPVLRYSDFSPNRSNPWVLAYQEDHTNDTPAEITSHVVAINTETTEVKRVLTGNDFYYTPRFNQDGTKLAWLQWNRPDMLFDKSELYWADFDAESCTVSNKTLIVGKNQGAAEPRWGPDGSLWYCAEKGKYRSLFRIPPDSKDSVEIKVNGIEDLEFGDHGLWQGARTYALMNDHVVVAAGYHNGQAKLVAIDTATGIYEQLADTEQVTKLSARGLARVNEDAVLVVADGISTPNTVRLLHIIKKDSNSVIRTSTDEELPKSIISKPQSMHLTSRGSKERPIYGFLWMPHNDTFTAPDETSPPLIIDLHGGPTAAAGAGLDLRVQYFTSRGYAYLKLNYTGSTCHGRDYRQSLFGHWGVVDAADAAEFADRLREAGRVGKVGITGISAGGYGTLQCITRHPETFDAGFCVSGISDLMDFDRLTHKMEMDYAAALVLHEGATEDEKVEIYKERSAMYHIDKIQTPLALLHSRDDSIVPIGQAEVIFDALKDKIDVKMVKLSGDGHSLTKPSSQKIWISEAEAWWRSHLL